MPWFMYSNFGVLEGKQSQEGDVLPVVTGIQQSQS